MHSKPRGNFGRQLPAGFVWSLMAASTAAIAQAPAPAMEVRLMAASCAACHGHEGRSTGVGLPLAGQSVEALNTKLLGFKSGQVPGTVMQQHAKGYSDDELKQLAQYFSQIKGEAK